jgi:hypothetical protein
MNKTRLIFEKQEYHLLFLIVLLFGLSSFSRMPDFWEGQALGVPTKDWFCIALVNTVGHQVFVWLCWRTQLHMDLLTRSLGKLAFRIYAVVFSIFLLARPILMTILAFSNRGTVNTDPLVLRTAALLLMIPVAWLGFSILKYFSFKRAFGIDHFDGKYRSLSLVRGGIFRITANAMYLFGFALLWAPAFYFASKAALALAGFSHLYIWVHYFTVEKPDMMRIYSV